MARMLEGKTAIVTGGGSGIGRATALVLAREGARVLVGDVDRKGGEETCRLIKEQGTSATFCSCDVTKAGDVEAMVAMAVNLYGRLDCAFNNAGIGVMKTTVDCTEEEWDQVLNVNLKGVWLCMKYEIAQMLKQGGGAIVNTSSVGGLVGTAGVGAYVASKHGVIGLTKTAALEYVRNGIRVNAVCPGVILTPMVEPLFADPEKRKFFESVTPTGRFGKPEEVAEAVAWLCSDAASLITGAALPVDGGVVAQ